MSKYKDDLYGLDPTLRINNIKLYQTDTIDQNALK